MIEEIDARRRILEATPVGEVECVEIAEAVGRYLANPIVGRVDLPGFDNSAMDGYAIRAQDAGSAGALLRVVGEQAAGAIEDALVVNSGEAIRIFTGAPIPGGADAVIMQEDTSRDGDSLVVEESVVAGEFIRRRGGDVCVGQQLFGAGTVVDAAVVGVVASQGIGRVSVHRRPNVAVVTTGDELVTPGRPLENGQIYNSNGPMLTELARQFGAGPVRSFHAVDDPEALSRTLAEALDFGDIVLIAGGVSVGDRDFVKSQLTQLGVSTDFWRVRVKPGKPFLFGQLQGARIFGLPGNPVSAYVTFLLFAAPAIARWQGRAVGEELPLRKEMRPLAADLRNRGDRPHYLRVKIDTEGCWAPVGRQESHALFGLSRADALLRLDGEQDLKGGEIAAGFLLKS